MQKVKLGKTPLHISRIGMGGIPIQRPPVDETIPIIQHVLDRGITFIDTVNGYGESEECIGAAISGTNSTLYCRKRKHFVVPYKSDL
jgi:aryl-alcohol dehydrogenase-like predicted oxidoreductase